MTLKSPPIRQLASLFLFGLLLYTIFHFFSPWRLVIEIRPTRTTDLVVSTQSSSPTELEEPDHKKNYIERNFGSLEEAFLKSVSEPLGSLTRSRDDSIRLIYDMKSPSDWLDLVEGHDDHVCKFISLLY